MSATVQRLFRYPIKSFQGVEVDELTIGATGVEGDRQYALVDDDTDRIASAKLDKDLLHATVSEGADGAVAFTLPDGATFAPGDAGVDASLSAWVGRPVTLTADDGASSRSYAMTFDPEDDGAETVEIPAPAGTFLDLAAVHVLTTGSIARCAEAAPGTEWDVRRFRPNVLVDLDDGGFPEDAWVGHRVRLGPVVIDVQMQTVRCAMPLRAQPGGIERDVNVFRTMRDVHNNHLGVYCAVVEPGTVRVGDPVEVVPG